MEMTGMRRMLEKSYLTGTTQVAAPVSARRNYGISIQIPRGLMESPVSLYIAESQTILYSITTIRVGIHYKKILPCLNGEIARA